MAVTSGAKRHQDIRAKWLKGKGNWFLESEEFRNWRNSEDQGGSKVFTCYGMPGAGKVGNEVSQCLSKFGAMEGLSNGWQVLSLSRSC